MVESDSTAALAVALKLSSNRPLMNALAGEISLILEGLNCGMLLGVHVPGVLNYVADALSRLSEGETIPSSLSQARRIEPPPRVASFYKAWPTDWTTASA